MSISKPVLILQLRPEDETADNEFAAFLKYGQLDESATHRIRIEKTGIPELLLEDYAAVIVGGSPFDISTPQAQKSTIQLRIESDFRRLFDGIVARDFPLLGACSGCGLLGAYLNTPISNRFAEPVGGIRVRLTDDGRRDPLLAGFPEQIDVLCGHKEACDQLPTGASLLMTGGTCPVQMFRVGKNVYATQFHPEADGEGIALRIQVYKHHGYFPPEEAQTLIDAVSGKDSPYGQELLRRFIARYT